MKHFYDEISLESMAGNIEDFQCLQVNSPRVPKELLECVKQGLSLEKIRVRLNWKSRQRVSKAISDYELTELWHTAKRISNMRKDQEKFLKNQGFEKLVSLLAKEAIFRAYCISWASGMAEELLHSLSKKERQYAKSREFYTGLFEKYDEARKNNQRLSYKRLAKELGVHPPYIRSVFKRLNLKPMYWSFEYKPRGSVTLDSLLEVYALGLSMSDIDFFIGRIALARQKLLNSGFKPTRATGVYKGKRFSYSMASQVYEASDLGFKPKDISVLIDKPENIVNSTIKKRDGAEGIIIEALNSLHPGKGYVKPYL